MKLVFRLFLAIALILSVAAPHTGAAETASVLHLPVLSAQIERKLHTIDGVEIGKHGPHIWGTAESPVLTEAIFDAEPEDSEHSESHFPKKFAEVSGYFTSYLDPVSAHAFLSPSKCSPVRGHFSFCSRRHVLLCVFRV
jgi:hypothetical protein